MPLALGLAISESGQVLPIWFCNWFPGHSSHRKRYGSSAEDRNGFGQFGCDQERWTLPWRSQLVYEVCAHWVSLWGWGGLGWSAVVKIRCSRARNVPSKGVGLGKMKSYFCTPFFFFLTSMCSIRFPNSWGQKNSGEKKRRQREGKGDGHRSNRGQETENTKF